MNYEQNLCDFHSDNFYPLSGQDMNKLFCLLQVKDEELWDDLVGSYIGAFFSFKHAYYIIILCNFIAIKFRRN